MVHTKSHASVSNTALSPSHTEQDLHNNQPIYSIAKPLSAVVVTCCWFTYSLRQQGPAVCSTVFAALRYLFGTETLNAQLGYICGQLCKCMPTLASAAGTLAKLRGSQAF